MIRLLWRFGLLVLAALFFTWLADRPGTVTIQWMGREIQMAFVIAWPGFFAIVSSFF
jgi:HemY protein